MTGALIRTTMTDLSNIDISDNREDLICYGFDSSFVLGVNPALVAWPRSVEEISRLLKYALEKDMSIVPRGAGTAMTGAAMPLRSNTMVISLEKMRKLLDINTKNMSVLVEPGILNGTLQKELFCLNFFYPPDPSSLNFCTLGGNVATNAGGPRAVKYGVTRDYVMELEAVLVDGTIIRCGGKTHKRVVGYDIKNLLIGSEGTLAIVTKIRLKILPLPEDVVTLLVSFQDTADAAATINKVLSSNIIPRTLEFIDKGCIKAVQSYKPNLITEAPSALLIIEIDGNIPTIKREAERVVAICNQFKGNAVLAADVYSRELIWDTRRSISPALYNLKKCKTNEDIVVPRDRIPEILLDISKISEENNTDILCFGHAGDGNIHVNILTDSREGQDKEKLERILKRLFEATLKLGGSISGEHGIGVTKAPFLSMEIPDRQITLMKEIKRVFDPQDRLNPGKIFQV